MKYIIFGAGNNAQMLLSQLRLNYYEVDFIVDNNKSRWGEKIQDLSIKSPTELYSIRRNEYHIVLSVSDDKMRRQICQQLIEMGFNEDINFSNGLELFNIFKEHPGKVSGYISIPDSFSAIKTFDEASRLITLKDEKRIFRIVNKAFSEQYLEAFRICKENNFFGHYIIETSISLNKWNLPYDLILEHKYIEPISYCFEWSPEMFYDYVNFMISMLKDLTISGLAISDGHTLNATISDGKFIFIDFGAIKTGIIKGSVLIEFLNTHIIPLILMNKKQMNKAYLFLKNPGIEYTQEDVQGYLNEYEQNELRELYLFITSITCVEDVLVFISKLSDYILNMEHGTYQTRWDGYQNDEWNWSDDVNKWSEKMKHVIGMINKVNPSTIVDLAGNMGWYGSYMREKLRYSIIVDSDYKCIDCLWKKVQNIEMNNVVPIYMSLCTPTLDYYRDDAIGQTPIEPWRKGAIDRFRSELVIALAVIHHLVFSQQLTFDEIVNQLALFSDRYLIVEFIDINDMFIEYFIKKDFGWYHIDNFVKALKERFEIIDSACSTPSDTRKIFLCELRKL